MKKFRIVLRTIYGELEIDDIKAKDEDEAVKIACKKAENELKCAKVDDIHEY